jgi:adenylosuccinate synthase
VNGAEWLVVTKLDVLDELEEIPICVGYEIGGRVTDEIPADVQGLEKIKPVYTKLKGWRISTEGIKEFDKLPAARERVSALSGTGERGQNRNGLDRPRPRPDHCLPEFAAALEMIHA